MNIRELNRLELQAYRLLVTLERMSWRSAKAGQLCIPAQLRYERRKAAREDGGS